MTDQDTPIWESRHHEYDRVGIAWPGGGLDMHHGDKVMVTYQDGLFRVIRLRPTEKKHD